MKPRKEAGPKRTVNDEEALVRKNEDRVASSCRKTRGTEREMGRGGAETPRRVKNGRRQAERWKKAEIGIMGGGGARQKQQGWLVL